MSKSNIAEFYPLSPIQQGILFHTLYQPKSSVYFGQLLCTLQGKINVAAFKESWQQVINRHSILRTAFVWEGLKEPIQVVRKQVSLPWEQFDWRGLSSIEQQAHLEIFLKKDHERNFELTSAPLIRITLIQLEDNTYQFIWSHHHLILDGWSLPLILKEVFAFYDAFCEGKELNLTRPRPYRDYIAWLHRQDLSAAESFWRETLKGFTAPTSLVIDKTLSLSHTENEQGECKIALCASMTTALQSLVRQHQLTLNTLVQGAWAMLLSRYSGEEDVVFGATVSGRPPELVGAESIVGMFINTLPMRVSVPAEASLLSWLKQLQFHQVELREYEYSPLVEIQQRWSQIPHNVPLFESIVVFENYPVDPALRERNSHLEICDVQSHDSTNYPITVMVIAQSELTIKISYDRRRFDADTITRMLGHLQTLLEGIVANPNQYLKDLPILTPAERKQLLELNNIADYSQNICLHQLFETQVEKTPDAVALIFEQQQLTYRELNQKANQLAHYLQSLGVNPEVLVGIYLERSLETIIGILGILKAGGAYLPIDPAYPKERLAFMLEDAQVPVLLTQKRLLETVPNYSGKIICLDESQEFITEKSPENPLSNVSAGHLAYVIYTSGSTGTPKGVTVTHSNVVRLFAATQPWYNFNAEDVWTVFHSIAFDFSVWEIWGALLYGGKLVVVPYITSRSPADFYQLLNEQKVTVLNQTPSAFRQLIKAEESRESSEELNLRLVIFGGEALELQSLKPWFERHGDKTPQLVNMYGITETTVHVTYRPLTKADLNATGSVIGRPIPDLQVYLLDNNRQPVPIGVPGEMYIGGAGVARGYLNRPELTAERFISNCFSDEPEARLYKSGDLARYLPNGELEYLGRIDHQVKIRGFRIELGEIEAALSQHPSVAEAVVIAREDELGDKRLVAYIVADEPLIDSQVSPIKYSELRSFLKEKLPEYMVPAAFVFLPSIPLTSNGKVDRRALPAPDTSRPELESTFAAPRTPEEKLFAEIWGQVLGLEKVGIHDNYFALGGDSIRSIQVQSLAKKQGFNISLQELFQYQTIAQLVEKIKKEKSEPSQPEKSQYFSLIGDDDKQRLPDGIEDAYPLAMLQMGMIFHSEYSQESATYHDIFSFHLKAPLDLQALPAAIQYLTNRHGILRTSLHLTGFSIPMQLVHQNVEIPLRVEDLRHLSNAEQENALNAWFELERNLHFNWNISPLLRFQIHRRTDDTFQLTLTFHHAILDGWSVASLLNELFGQYFLLLGKKAGSIALPPTSTFRDFVALEQAVIASQEQQHYWSEKLNDSSMTVLPRWPAFQQKQKVQQICVQDVSVPPEISEGLKQLAKSADVPLKSVLLAAHLRVLNLLTGQVDILTGLVANGRPEQTDGERILGLFLNTLPLRLQLSGGTWIDLVRQVFEAEREVLPFRRYPLAEIQKNQGNQPLFETAFNYVNFHVYQGLQELEDVRVLGQKFLLETNFPLFADFSLDPFSSEVELSLEYDAVEFSHEQIQAITGYYARTLAAMVSEPLGRYERHLLLSEGEQNQLLVEWNNTPTKSIQEQYIHQVFEAQVERAPDAVAVVFEDHQLTYDELNEKANQLAHYLQEIGVKPEVLVGICVERSVEIVIAVLGVLKAGGAYLPLDPAYPQQRLAVMLEDAQVSIILTQKRLLETLPSHQAKVVCLDNEQTLQINNQNYFKNPQLTQPCFPSNLAYVIYTSGSTGTPKGVMISHGNLSNAYAAWKDAYSLDSTPTCHLQMANFSFDVFSGDLIRALCFGGKLVLCPRDFLLEPEKLYQLMLQEEVDSAEFVPAVLRSLIQYLEKTNQSLKFMRLLIAGSDSWYGKEYQEVKRFCGLETRVINSYGLTEATIDSTYFESDVTELQSEGLIPIGRPFAGTQTYILDSHLQPVPIGVFGELCIGGKGLARGYLNRPDLTAEKFIPNPFFKEKEKSPLITASSRLYKTGDLARYLPDGTIELLGRIDYQEKIRGFRIELSEIEAIISQHPKVEQSVVTVWKDAAGNKNLVAYVVSTSNFGAQNPNIGDSRVPCLTHPTAFHFPNNAAELIGFGIKSELRGFLKEKLPDYMVPATFVLLETLPLTPNGKVDRRALPAPQLTTSDLKENFAAPRTPIEEVIAQTYALVLGVEKVGIYDNFFELGGHSLLATQVISRLREAFQIAIPLSWLFESPAVASLTIRIETALKSEQKFAAPPIHPVPRNQTLPLSFAQQRMWLLQQLAPDSSLYNSPVAVRLKGSLNLAALEQSLNEIIQRHEALRTSFVEMEGELVQIIHGTVKITLPMIDLSEVPASNHDAEVRRLAIEDAVKPFDLTQCPLLRATLLRLNSQEHITLLTMHHIVSDGWSMGVFLKELAALYEAFCAGNPSPLPELPVQYADFAVWQRQWLQGEVLQSQLNYWKQQLSGRCPQLKFSTNGLKSSVSSNRGAKQSFIISKDVSEALSQLSRQEGVTLFMTLLAAFQTLLYCNTGTKDIRIGSPIANRNQVEIEKLIGFFINTLVLRNDLSDNPTFREMMRRCRTVALGAYAHQDLPFEKLVEELQPERNLNHNPMYQAWFVLQNAPMPPLELAGLTLSLFELGTETARHDLLLDIWEIPEGLNASFEYKTDLFDQALITRLIRDFDGLLNQVVAQPNSRLSELAEIIAETGRQAQLIQEKELQATGRQKLKMSKRKAIQDL
ncbi:non-ribosomal peptide synthetase [Microcoleus sp. FACHB-68]|uniref:non-ribosomal peptide synthetase n=1 Tax=Microcoleus sp. FACHB-68 TaxID=2692826 RepID=UPI0016844E09|nr:non-ribosomal peptide synthetase [Microcoleus sp. FACHB-68]MBD1938352.1 amino acid adenylation domain-containing protein [Microcoleus sp. FACHB-68]